MASAGPSPLPRIAVAAAVLLAAVAAGWWYFTLARPPQGDDVLAQVIVEDGDLRYEFDGWEGRATIWDVSGADPVDVTEARAERLPEFRRRAEARIGMTLDELTERCKASADHLHGLGYR